MAQVSRITLPSACDVRAWPRDNRNGFETHDRGGRTEDSKGECVREGGKKLYLNALSVSCSGEVAQEKVACLYTRLSSHEDAERFRRRFRVSAGTSNKCTV